jgi:hypothetical protein
MADMYVNMLGDDSEFPITKIRELASHFAFDMTDWRDDRIELQNYLEYSSKRSKDDLKRFVLKYLCHAVPHLNEAYRLVFREEPSRIFTDADDIMDKM